MRPSGFLPFLQKYNPNQPIHSHNSTSHFSNIRFNIIMLSTFMSQSLNSTVGIATDRYNIFNVLHSVQTVSWIHPASYPMGTEGKAAGS
jgi:hypothetical protein